MYIYIYGFVWNRYTLLKWLFNREHDDKHMDLGLPYPQTKQH